MPIKRHVDLDRRSRSVPPWTASRSESCRHRGLPRRACHSRDGRSSRPRGRDSPTRGTGDHQVGRDASDAGGRLQPRRGDAPRARVPLARPTRGAAGAPRRCRIVDQRRNDSRARASRYCPRVAGRRRSCPSHARRCRTRRERSCGPAEGHRHLDEPITVGLYEVCARGRRRVEAAVQAADSETACLSLDSSQGLGGSRRRGRPCRSRSRRRRCPTQAVRRTRSPAFAEGRDLPDASRRP